MIKYHAFAKAVEMRSISKAAEILGYSRSKLSNIIGSLEDELGLRLLEEEDDSVVLTESGKKLIPYCQQIVETERKLKFEALSMLNQSEDSIRIGTPNSMLVGFVSDLIARFTQDHEDITLSIQEDTLANVGRQLISGDIDVAFLTEEFAANTMFYPLFEDEICLAVNKSHPLAQQDALMAHDLRDVPIIYSPPGWDDITRIVINRLPFKPNIRCYSASDLAALAMVQSNMGVYVISNLQKSLLPKDVVAISFQEHYRRTVGVAVRSMKDLTDSQRTFVDACIESFK